MKSKALYKKIELHNKFLSKSILKKEEAKFRIFECHLKYKSKNRQLLISLDNSQRQH